MGGDRVRVLLVEDEEILARSVTRLLEAEAFEVGHAVDATSAVSMLRAADALDPWAFLILDLALRHERGERVLEKLGTLINPPPVAIWTGYGHTIERVSLRHVVRFLHKADENVNLAAIIKDVLGSPQTYFVDAFLRGLSGRMADCARLSLSGLTAKDIGDDLAISHRTVEEYLRQVYEKFGCRTHQDFHALLLEKAKVIPPRKRR